MCGAFGPTQFSHFDCTISAPRPLPDTIVAQFKFRIVPGDGLLQHEPERELLRELAEEEAGDLQVETRVTDVDDSMDKRLQQLHPLPLRPGGSKLLRKTLGFRPPPRSLRPGRGPVAPNSVENLRS